MLHLGQRDEKWKDTLIGNSKTTIGQAGCLITSLCMLLTKFYPERGFKHYYTPIEAAKNWNFVPVVGDSDPKYLNWISTAFHDMEFVWRQYGYSPYILQKDPVTGESDTMVNILRKYMEHPKYGVVLQVETWSGNQHWLAGIGKSIIGWAANDPWYRMTTWSIPLPYKKITGYTIMKRTI